MSSGVIPILVEYALIARNEKAGVVAATRRRSSNASCRA
jgi:hypothetical protein